MSEKVFYSWQSDLPNSTNRGFIQTALEAAAKAIREDETIEVEPVVDRDTAGVPGSPDISKTIFAKIDESQVFVCDVSIINQASTDEDRPTPNPNVLIELGYALKVLGLHRIIMVMNTAFGQIDQLPFDLRLKRVVTFNMPLKVEERAPERKRLQAILEEALRAILENNQEKSAAVVAPPLVDQARLAIEEGSVNRVALASRYMESLVRDINRLAPNLSTADAATLDERLVQAIYQTGEVVANFAQLSEAIGLHEDQKAAEALYTSFGPILEGYDLPANFGGGFRDVQFDFHKFIGHELFVVFISKLIRHERWDVVGQLLNDGIYAANADRGMGGLLSFQFISAYVKLLEYRNQRLNSRRASLHADTLNERHSGGRLGDVSPMEDFLAGDFFLFLRSSFAAAEKSNWFGWSPWSIIYLTKMPQFMTKSLSSKYANRLLPALGIDSISIFRSRFVEAWARLARMFERSGGMRYIDFRPQEIGSDRFIK